MNIFSHFKTMIVKYSILYLKLLKYKNKFRMSIILKIRKNNV